MSLLNLKEILTSDTAAEKLDKINYNFDVLVNSSGPAGASGLSGVDGIDGVAGEVGPVGPQGDIGETGGAGSSSDGEWISTLYTNSGASTMALSPKLDSGYATTSISIGHPDIDAATYSSVTDKSQLTIYNNSAYDSSIRLVGTSANFFDININNNGLTLGFNEDSTGQTLNLKANELLFSDLSDVSIISADVAGITFNKDTDFTGADVEIDTGLKLDFGTPAVDKIACSSDNEGSVVWKSLSEIASAIPVGMIVPILPSILSDSSNFTQSHDFTLDSNSASEMWVGRGIGDYVGWYVCNGYEWSNGVDSFDTPDLNSFSVNIDVNQSPDNAIASSNEGQFDFNDGDLGTNIIGNASISSSSETNSTIHTLDSDIVHNSLNRQLNTETLAEANHEHVKIVRVPHIIYLGSNDLTWSNSGLVQVKLIYNANHEYGLPAEDGGSYVPAWIWKTNAIRVNSDEFLVDPGTGLIVTGDVYDQFLWAYSTNGESDIYTYRLFSDSTGQIKKPNSGLSAANSIRKNASNTGYYIDSDGFIAV